MAGMTQDPEAWARLGAKMREQREKLGMSRRQLSSAAGVSEKSIQTAEDGRTPRARWPQSLRLIENALRWEPGSMERILEGGEPQEFFDLFTLNEEAAKASIAAQEPMFPRGPLGGDSASEEELSSRLARLPHALRLGLTEVLGFGEVARRYGVDPHVAEEYEQALERLLIDLVERAPLSYQWEGPPPRNLVLWNEAVRQGPFLRRMREDRMRAEERAHRRMMSRSESLFEMTQPGRPEPTEEYSPSDVARKIDQLGEEVRRLRDRIQREGRSKPSE